MALEQSATYLASLVQTNPDGSTDLLSTVDNHLRLVKGAIKRSFPSLDQAVTANQTDLNKLVGLTVSVPDSRSTFRTAPYSAAPFEDVSVAPHVTISLSGVYLVDGYAAFSISGTVQVDHYMLITGTTPGGAFARPLTTNGNPSKLFDWGGGNNESMLEGSSIFWIHGEMVVTSSADLKVWYSVGSTRVFELLDGSFRVSRVGNAD